jgi:hypothetical protein
VWVRIQRRRRVHHLVALALALTAGGVGGVLARAGLADAPAPVEVRVDLGSPRRADGSASLRARWQVRWAGGEVRVYRNALGAVLRCPGAAACALHPGGGVVSLVVDVPGEYRAVVFSRPLASSGATMQEDLTRARARGDPVEISSSLVVY